MRLDRCQLFGFACRRCNDQLSAIAVWNALLAAIPVEGLLAADAHLRHQAAGAVIDSGVDDFAVARGSDGADSFGRLQHDHLAAALSQLPRHGKADHSRPDNDALDLFHLKNSDPDLACSSGWQESWPVSNS